MKDIEPVVSILVKEQFPDFYKEDGPNFILFVQEYFKYLEQTNNVLYHSRRLLEYRDIDQTIDDFVIHFKEKYLKFFPFDIAQEDTRFLIKHILDFYRSKGSEQSYEIFFKSVYNEVPQFYYPKQDIFTLSDGKWFKPVYLEVESAINLQQLNRKQVVGSISRATAFVESIIRRRVGTKYIDVLYLSNASGTFIAGDVVTIKSNPIIANFPKVIGSLTTVDVITGGENFNIGDIIILNNGSGVGGKLRVTEVTTETGIVRFALVDGGYGFSTNSQILVSTKVLDLQANSINTQDFETVYQPLANISFFGANGTLANGNIVQSWYSNGSLAGNGVILNISYSTGTEGVVLVSTRSGNVANGVSGVFTIPGNSIGAVVNNYSDITASGNVIGKNTSSIGVINVIGTFVTTTGNFIYGSNSGVNTSVIDVGSGTSASFEIGSLTNQETVRLDLTTLKANNGYGVLYTNLRLDGSNANTGLGNSALGFPKRPSTNVTSGTLLGVIEYYDKTIGTIAGLISINGGEDYTKTPFVRVFEPHIAGYNKKDYIVVANNVSASFGVGEYVTQNASISATTLTVGSTTGNTNVEAGEYIFQSDGTSNVATGTIYSSSLTGGVGTITVVDVVGSFVNTFQTKTLTSNANSVISSVNATSSIARSGRGLIANTTTINSIAQELRVKRLTFQDLFSPGGTLLSQSTGTTGTVVSVIDDVATRRIGDNANVTANVALANNTIVSAVVYDSGFGYIEDETADGTLQGNNALEATFKLHVQSQGVGIGSYRNSKSFLSEDKYLHDGTYYQNFSYEVQTSIPFDKYKNVLTDLVHIAGTKMFGKLVDTTHANVIITSNTVISVQ